MYLLLLICLYLLLCIYYLFVIYLLCKHYYYLWLVQYLNTNYVLNNSSGLKYNKKKTISALSGVRVNTGQTLWVVSLTRAQMNIHTAHKECTFDLLTNNE